MPFIAAVTQPSWIDALQLFGFEGEVNFWRPGRQSISADLVGSYMIFVRKGSSPRKVMGFGKIKGFETMTITDAWARWNVRNGVPTLREFIDSVAAAALSTSSNGGGLKNVINGQHSEIGCTILQDVTFFDVDKAPAVDVMLPDFPKQVVSYKRYSEPFPPLLQGVVEQASSVQQQGLRRYDEPDPAKIATIDVHAMQCVRLYCAEMSIQDVSTPIRAYQTVGEYHPGYDLLVHNGVDEYHVEVKGTSLSRVLVKITRNEMRRASVDPSARLAVVSRIRLTQDAQQWTASGGVVAMYKWIQQERLRQILQSVGDYSQNGLSCKVDEWTVDPDSCEFLARADDEFRPESV